MLKDTRTETVLNVFYYVVQKRKRKVSVTEEKIVEVFLLSNSNQLHIYIAPKCNITINLNLFTAFKLSFKF